jgi:hypothetical protein
MKALVNIFRQYSVWLLAGLTLVAWFKAPNLIYRLDPVAGFFDAGVLQIAGFAAYCMMVFWLLAWLIMRLAFPDIFSYFFHELDDVFQSKDYNLRWIKLVAGFLLLLLFGLSFWVPLLALRAV